MSKLNEQFSFTFSKKEKLKSIIEIDSLFATGKVIKVFPFRILYSLRTVPTQVENPKVLISVPKRKHKLAVSRNLLKRRTREAFRLNKPTFQESLKKIESIGIIYVSNQSESFKFINDKLILALERLSETLNQNNNE